MKAKERFYLKIMIICSLITLFCLLLLVLDGKNYIGVKSAYAKEGFDKPTTVPALQESVLTITSEPTQQVATPTPEPTPIINPYDFMGVAFDNKEEVQITFFFPDEEISIDFVPITYDTPEGSAFCKRFPKVTKNACVYAYEEHTAIFIHSGCDPKPLLAEELRVKLDKGGVCQFPRGPSKNFKEYEGIAVLIRQGGIVLEMTVERVGYFPTDQVQISILPQDILGLVGVGFSSEKRSITIVTSGRNANYFPNYSAARWFIILTQTQGGLR